MIEANNLRALEGLILGFSLIICSSKSNGFLASIVKINASLKIISQK